MPSEILNAKRANVLQQLQGCNELIVALSGGVDSAVLLALALAALGPDRVIAVTGRSASLAGDDLDDARAVADHLGARHVILDTRELDRPAYRANTGDRCFHCRSELFQVIDDYVRDRGRTAQVAYGAITDDVGDYRPGMAAATRMGVLAPLLEAGLTKQDVRDVARELGLPVRDKPAAACLASRIPVGMAVTPGRLEQVERAEAGLRALGFVEFRVRHHGDVARIETDSGGERLLADARIREQAILAVRSSGFRFVALDLDGYRPGSLNPPGAAAGISPKREGGQ